MFSFDKLQKQCRIAWDTAEENHFNVHTENGIVKFKLKDGVHVHKMSDDHKKEAAAARGSIDQGGVKSLS